MYCNNFELLTNIIFTYKLLTLIKHTYEPLTVIVHTYKLITILIWMGAPYCERNQGFSS